MQKRNSYPTRPSIRHSKSFFSGVFACIFSLSILLGGCTLSGCTPDNPLPQDDDAVQPSSNTSPDSYETIFDIISAIVEEQEADTNERNAEVFISEESSSADISSAESSTSSDAGSYSNTNTQVDGIDESDIVKTDGENIFMIAGEEIVIARAEGKDTKEIARFALDKKSLAQQEGEDLPLYPNELYVIDDMLVVLYNYSPNEGIDYIEEYAGTEDSGDTEENAGTEDSIGSSVSYCPDYYRSISEIACYDISDAMQPKRVNSFGQDGSYVSSRVQDGILYLITDFPLYSTFDMTRDDPSTYVPFSYTGDNSELMDVDDICISPSSSSINYTIVSSIDIANNRRIDQQSILGNSETTYMSENNLYLAGSDFEKEEENSYQDGSFIVTEYTEIYSTYLSRLSLNEGNIDVAASATLPGVLLNQFSLDEYEGNIRAATTIDKNKYRVIADSKGEITDYNSFETEPSTNSLYVLDENLEPMGSIEGLAKDERVYSVRFDGPVGYMVTFKQVDPLFCVDLSDPANPTIKDVLKIPGFSTYMHPYSENRLFGLGMATDSQGATTGLKMSIFDTADPYNVTEKNMLSLDLTYSDALYDHKAIMVSAGQNIIGFPTETGYSVYGYSDEKGFYLRQEFKSDSDYYFSGARGLFVDDCFYICSEGNIGVYELDSLKEVAQVPIEISE